MPLLVQAGVQRSAWGAEGKAARLLVLQQTDDDVYALCRLQRGNRTSTTDAAEGTAGSLEGAFLGATQRWSTSQSHVGVAGTILMIIIILSTNYFKRKT
jgi:hypothetical protein